MCIVYVNNNYRDARPNFLDAVRIWDPFQSRPMLHVRLDHAIRYATGDL